jgi:hypothetical protein
MEGIKTLSAPLGELITSFMHMAFWIENDKLCNGTLSYKVHICDVGKIGHYFYAIGLCHSLDGITNPKYKLFGLQTTIIFYKEKKALAFNQDRCWHLALCLWLILFHWHVTFRIPRCL